MPEYFHVPNFGTGNWIVTPIQNDQWYTWSTGTSTTITYPERDPYWYQSTWNDWVNTGTISYTTMEVREMPTEQFQELRAREDHEERRRRLLERDAESRARFARIQQERAQAQERAIELLKMVLSPAELAIYEETEQIIITGSAGGRYHIYTDDYQGNVVQLSEDGQELMGLCAHPRMWDQNARRIPNADAWTAQILALKSDEENFLSVANVHWSNQEVRVRARQVAAA